MPNLEQFALMLLKKNPKIANSPQGKEFLDILESGDSERGQQMARNYCKSYGDTPEEAYNKAQNFFFKNLN